MIKCTDILYDPRDLKCIVNINDYLDFLTIDIYLLQVLYKFKNKKIYM